ncbi:hypothetical protein PUNSTDRAFT_146102 [Punctularia strigosozonata HHB-11173 SS5]|uniref:Uncharacterized protein n=1 Tax=Punctularia strigosozonata (strain HHB-11173) TaxID=741275 RepID=R7S5Y2_PUNST|nr:uncharacterized protein PUNSTDRAFT_146102 [Punctularia strigosozonata HHB-11173 SS5]EIN05261.1 hypothetical protein PUNSTDRAFT_146102 [Punctularia strigosozonata HHB-11173 SS5]
MSKPDSQSKVDPATEPPLDDIDHAETTAHSPDNAANLDVKPPRRVKRHPEVPHDPRFDRPVPSIWKRVALLLFTAVLFYLAVKMRFNAKTTKPQTVYANRYSKEYKYRPAASPIVTERLKDGRTRIRGAQPQIIRGYQYQ